MALNIIFGDLAPTLIEMLNLKSRVNLLLLNKYFNRLIGREYINSMIYDNITCNYSGYTKGRLHKTKPSFTYGDGVKSIMVDKSTLIRFNADHSYQISTIRKVDIYDFIKHIYSVDAKIITAIKALLNPTILKRNFISVGKYGIRVDNKRYVSDFSKNGLEYIDKYYRIYLDDYSFKLNPLFIYLV